MKDFGSASIPLRCDQTLMLRLVLTTFFIVARLRNGGGGSNRTKFYGAISNVRWAAGPQRSAVRT